MTVPINEAPMSKVSVDESTVVLGIETSCDETAVAVVMGGTDVLSSVVASQLAEHARFGGVVPEIASRAHLEALPHVTAQAMQQADIDLSRVDAVAATVGPGLIGALLVGVSAAKATALALDVPFIGVNHLEAHLYAALLDEPNAEFPMLFGLVSGGHTLFVEMLDYDSYRVIGQTIDDAAGEAFDKTAKLLGLDYPGGAALSKLAESGKAAGFDLPRPMLHSKDLDFSFSGLKTAVLHQVKKAQSNDCYNESFCANLACAFVEAVTDVLSHKAMAALEQMECLDLVVAGGVGAPRRTGRHHPAAVA